MWNDAFNIGGPACTIEQFEQLTHVPVDHFIVVDFAGFKSMVDAIGGVEVCLPHAVERHRSATSRCRPAPTSSAATQALNYVRERHDLGNGSDIGRMKRQQAFIASMAHAAVSANTLANPIHLTKFLDAATKSLTVDPGLKSIAKLVGLGLPVPPHRPRQDPVRHHAVGGRPQRPQPRDLGAHGRRRCGRTSRSDEPLPKSLLDGSINAHHIPGVTHSKPGNKPSNSEAEQQAARTTSPTASAPDARADAVRRRADPAGPSRQLAEAEPAEPDWQRRRRLAAVFGDVLPETTSDERDPEAAAERGRGRRRPLAARARCRRTTADDVSRGGRPTASGVGVAGGRAWCRRSAREQVADLLQQLDVLRRAGLGAREEALLGLGVGHRR